MEYKMKRVLELLVAVLFGLLVFWVYYTGWWHKVRAVILFEKPVHAAIPVPAASKPELSLTNNSVSANAPPSAQIANINLNEIQVAADAHIAKYNGWRQSRGQFVTREIGDYESYSDDVLTSLTKQGDLKASMVLMNRYLSQGKVKESTHIANIATVFGSTWGLYLLTKYAGPSFAPKEHSRTAALESLAIIRVMEMRGDPELAEDARSDLARGNRVDLHLSEEEKLLVNQRADQIYLKYQAIRTAKGLGDFDNSPSPFAKTL